MKKIKFQTTRSGSAASSNISNKRLGQRQEIDGIFIMKKLGDYNRYGLLPLQCLQSLSIFPLRTIILCDTLVNSTSRPHVVR